MPALVKAAPQILKTGGCTKVHVSQVEYGCLLEGRRVLVTGGASGIGYAIAQKALSMGAEVLITGRNAQKLEDASRKLCHENLKSMIWDVSKITSHKERLTHAKQLLSGEIDILINNAGIITSNSFLHVSAEDWDRVYGTNSRGLFFLTQEVCSEWVAERANRVRKVLNISSQGGYVAAPHPYRMSKWDVAGFTQGIACVLAPYNVIVNGIAPGIIATDMQPDYNANAENKYCAVNPMRRTAAPEEIAELAGFLMSDASNFITGQTILCDGGYTLKI
jgi:NAD(P)-dependent dehydrogenase (short-subunit alcohol dehydrogenase family)